MFEMKLRKLAKSNECQRKNYGSLDEALVDWKKSQKKVGLGDTG